MTSRLFDQTLLSPQLPGRPALPPEPPPVLLYLLPFRMNPSFQPLADVIQCAPVLF